jgi:predicted nucleic acid-binding protein
VSFVLDSSMALSWCFTDEQTPESLEVLKLSKTRAVFVPLLWHLEMANVLGISFRKGRLSGDDLSLALKVFAALEIHTDALVHEIRKSLLLPLMQAFSLTAYDAVYLELAMRLNLPLATLDAALLAAAKQAGASVLYHP